MNLFDTLDVQTIHALLPLGHGQRHLTAEMYYRKRMELVWELVSKPLKFPSRRRRSDREVPKAA